MSSLLPPEVDPAQVSAYSPEQWQTILRNAQVKLRTNPQDARAWSAIQDASSALKNSEAYPQHGKIDQLSKFNSPGLTPESMSSGAADFFKNLAWGAGGEVAAAPLAAAGRVVTPYVKESLEPLSGLAKPISNAARWAGNKVLPKVVKEHALPSGISDWLAGVKPDAGESMLQGMRKSSAAARGAQPAGEQATAFGVAQGGQSANYVQRMNNPDVMDIPTFMRRGPKPPLVQESLVEMPSPDPDFAKNWFDAHGKPPMPPHDPELSPSTFDALKAASEKAEASGGQSAISPELAKFSSEAEPSVLSKAIEKSHALQQAGKPGEAARVIEDALQQVTEAPKPSVFPKEGMNMDAKMQKMFEGKRPEDLKRLAQKWIAEGLDQRDPTMFKNLLNEIEKRFQPNIADPTGAAGNVGAMPSSLLRP